MADQFLTQFVLIQTVLLQAAQLDINLLLLSLELTLKFLDIGECGPEISDPWLEPNWFTWTSSSHSCPILNLVQQQHFSSSRTDRQPGSKKLAENESHWGSEIFSVSGVIEECLEKLREEKIPNFFLFVNVLWP